MDFADWLPIIICLIPSLYVAWNKTYVIIPNEKYDNFLSRFMFIGSVLFINTLFIFFFFYVLIDAFLPADFPRIVSMLSGSVAGSFLVLLYFRVFVLHNDIPFERRPDFMDFSLYVYTPVFKPNDYVFTPLSDETPYAAGHKEITVHLKNLKGPVIFTRSGELIVSREALGVFHQNGLSGFHPVPVRDTKTKRESDDYFLIITDHMMPAFSKKSTIKTGVKKERIVFSGNIFYDKSAMNDCKDFNRSSEMTDKRSIARYGLQRYWILSQKAVRVLVGQLGQSKRDFLPVYLDDDG